ncbi:MAG TPA: hypothetical protein PKN41_06440 [Bacteroidales bacterium]|nr:hypothetical protein [Bacteroidales bacterium]
MKKIFLGIVFGILAGLIDVTPMIIQDLSWDANISAFSMWVVIGFLLSIIELKMNSILKGILISYLVLLPLAVLIGWKEPISLIPIFVMTTILGGLLGFTINKFGK